MNNINSVRVNSTTRKNTRKNKFIVDSRLDDNSKVKQIKFEETKSEEKLRPSRIFIFQETHSTMTLEDFSERWNISVAQEALILRVTTQNLLRSIVMSI